MSAKTRASTSDTTAGASEEYKKMLDTLDDAIEEARRKISNGRVRDEAKEKVRIKWVRALAYAVNVRRQVTADRDLAELAEEVDRIKKQKELS
jgi:hypothetical protein